MFDFFFNLLRTGWNLCNTLKSTRVQSQPFECALGDLFGSAARYLTVQWGCRASNSPSGFPIDSMWLQTVEETERMANSKPGCLYPRTIPQDSTRARHQTFWQQLTLFRPVLLAGPLGVDEFGAHQHRPEWTTTKEWRKLAVKLALGGRCGRARPVEAV